MLLSVLKIRSLFHLDLKFALSVVPRIVHNRRLKLGAIMALMIMLFSQAVFATKFESVPKAVLEKETEKALDKAPEKINVSFVSPNPPASGYWQHYDNAMKAAAKSLNINLTIIHSKDLDRFAYIEAIDEVDINNTDYVVALLKINVADKLLTKFENTSVKVITGNLEIPQQHAAQIGLPRQKFKNWIGHVIPDDYHAGQLLATQLLSDIHLIDSPPISILAISGSRDSSVSYLRNKGLLDHIASDGRFRLEQVLYTDWTYETARQRFELLQQRFPDTRVIWSASDEIAQAVLDVFSQKHLISLDKAGLESTSKSGYRIGGIDWSVRAISMYDNPNFVTSIGGHFLEGGIVLAMLRDYHDGIDFVDTLGIKLLMKMGTLSDVNKQQIEDLIVENNWQKLHFELLSKSLGGDNQPLKADYQQVLDFIYH